MAKRKAYTPSAVEPFLILSDAEKDEVVAEFDQPFIGETFGPPTPRAGARSSGGQRASADARKSVRVPFKCQWRSSKLR